MRAIVRPLSPAFILILVSFASSGCTAPVVPEHTRSGLMSGVYTHFRHVGVTDREHLEVAWCMDDLNQFHSKEATRAWTREKLLSEPDRFAPYLAQLIVWGELEGQVNALELVQVALVERRAKLSPTSTAILFHGAVKGLWSRYGVVRHLASRVLQEATELNFGTFSRRSSRLSPAEEHSRWMWQDWVDTEYPFHWTPSALVDALDNRDAVDNNR